jgi:hypothetical protein
VVLHSLVAEMSTGQVAPNESKYLLWPIRMLFTTTGGESFYLYFQEQHGDFVAPPSVPHFLGSPEPGLTNSQLAAEYGAGVFTYVMPPSALPKTGFDGQAALTMDTSLSLKAQIPAGTFLVQGTVDADGTVTSRFTTDLPCQPFLALDQFNGEYAPITAPMATDHVVQFNLPGAQRWVLWARGEQGQVTILRPRGVS